MRQAFNKNLFTSVTSYPTLVAFEIILVAQMVVAFPLCMTRRCLRARTTMRARLNGTAFWFLAAAIPRGSYAEARESLTQVKWLVARPRARFTGPEPARRTSSFCRWPSG